MTDRDDARVEYTVKELLARIERNQAEGFTRVETSMAAKADKADVARLETTLHHHAQRLAEHAQEIDGLKQWKRDRQVAASTHQQRDRRTWTLRQKVWAATGTIFLGACTILAAVIAAGGVH